MIVLQVAAILAALWIVSLGMQALPKFLSETISGLVLIYLAIRLFEWGIGEAVLPI